jgi:DNA invertase Pin-like site-specific DNA recombinase
MVSMYDGTARPLRVLGYVRVSTSEQATSGAGLAAQQVAIETACAHQGHELVKVWSDAGWSAATLDRPAIAAALVELDHGRADALMVAKLDRLSRSLLDFSGLMERARRRGWTIVALDLGLDTSTPAGEMMANILAVFSQFERRLIGQRTKDALAAKRASGVRLGRPRAIPADVVERIVSDRAAGLTLTSIAQRLTDDGVPTVAGGARWYASTVRQVLQYVRPLDCDTGAVRVALKPSPGHEYADADAGNDVSTIRGPKHATR